MASRECLKIIESKSKFANSRSKPVVAKVSTSTSTSGISPDVSELKDMVKALLLDKKNQSQAPAHQTPASVKAVEESCVTCGGALIQSQLSRQTRMAIQGPIYQPQVNQPPAYQAPVYQAPAPQTQGVSKTDFDSYVKANDAVMRNAKPVMLLIKDPLCSSSSSSPKVMNRDTEVIKDTMLPTNNGSTKDVQPLVVQVQS
ncbi:hypothetical protein Tco_0521857 [Tanacetum coccineum]